MPRGPNGQFITQAAWQALQAAQAAAQVGVAPALGWAGNVVQAVAELPYVKQLGAVYNVVDPLVRGLARPLRNSLLLGQLGHSIGNRLIAEGGVKAIKYGLSAVLPDAEPTVKPTVGRVRKLVAPKILNRFTDRNMHLGNARIIPDLKGSMPPRRRSVAPKRGARKAPARKRTRRVGPIKYGQTAQHAIDQVDRSNGRIGLSGYTGRFRSDSCSRKLEVF